jgi:hypothetical protein
VDARTGAQQSAWLGLMTYSYSLQRTAYSGHVRRKFMLNGRAKKWAASYPDGRSLIARFNPDNAADSVLFEIEQGAWLFGRRVILRRYSHGDNGRVRQ